MAQTSNLGASSLSGSSTTRVQYDFESAADKSDWQVRRLTIRESISALYAAEVEVVCSDLSANPADLLGHDCAVTLIRDAQVERLCGIVGQVQNIGQVDRYIVANIQIVPALRALDQRTDCRIFQDMTSVEIIEDVLKRGFADYNRKVRNQLTGTYAKREYTVQYREPDLAFISRLMQYEGISYYFDHQGNVEEMVLGDSSDQYPQIETYDGDPVSFVPERGELNTAEAVNAFYPISQAIATSVTVRDFDWSRPSLLVESKQQTQHPHDGERDFYDLAHLNIGDYSPDAYHKIDNANQALLIKQGIDQTHRVFSGNGYVTAFRPGEVFELVDHTTPEFNGTYLITSVTHTRPATDSEENEKKSALESYQNSFSCILFDDKVPYRPAGISEKPSISGIQTALVVGPAGEEVHTDEHGRIKVQFYWDRLGKRDDHSSCWVRVAQAWAGPGYGALFIPRIGMEVLVTFIEGDPDRPLVIGCVYNGENRTAVDLEQPKYKTRSAIRTASSPGAKGYNEIRFEDMDGAEELFVHAQKTHTIEVGADRNKSVGGNQSEKVAKNKTIEIQGDHTETVHGNYATTINKAETRTVVSDQSVTVQANQSEVIGGNADKTIGKNYELTVASASNESVGGQKSVAVGGAYSEDVGAARSASAGGAWSVTSGASASVEAAKNAEIKAAKNATVEAGETQTQKAKKWLVDIQEQTGIKGGKKGVIELQDELQIKCGSATISLKKNGDITIKGAKISIKGSGDVVIKGSKVAQN